MSDREPEMMARCAQILGGLTAPKRWMSAAALAKRIGDPAWEADRLRAALIRHTAQPGRAIRYCMYPSRANLDVLWGSIQVVGERELHPLERQGMAEAEETELAADPVNEAVSDKPPLFLSHNHRDSIEVVALRAELVKHGHNVWIFEDGIDFGEIIIDSVQAALTGRGGFLAYMSRNYLGSPWVDKELDQVLGAEPVTWVASGQDAELLELLEKIDCERPQDIQPMVKAYAQGCESPYHVAKLLRTVLFRMIDSADRRVLVFPWMRAEGRWHGGGGKGLVFAPVAAMGEAAVARP